jgi:hypothetical protein
MSQRRALAPHATQSEFLFVDSRLKKDAFKEAVKVSAMRTWSRKRQRQRSSHLSPPRGGELQLWSQAPTYQENPEGKPHLVDHPVTAVKDGDQNINVSTPVNSVKAGELKCGTTTDSSCNLLAVGRCDPFRQLPYEPNCYINKLVNYCMLGG